MRKRAPYILLVAGAVLLDQITKYLAGTFINQAEPIKILPFIQLVNVKNVGAAFGIFKALGNNVFIALSVTAIVFIAIMLYKDRESSFSLSLILSGAIGNLIDRVFLGSVRDFIDISIGSYHWPAFNVADSCLTVGIFVLLLWGFRKKHHVS
ncbi:MAG: signal peptidase II [Nitrospirae bacterium]|nr:signal peptidase II [Nitrospirota bacterium]